MMGPGMMMMGGGRGADMCGPRAAGLAEWRLDRIERAVRPNDAQKAKYLPLLSREWVGSYALSEAGSGSDHESLLQKGTAAQEAMCRFDLFFHTLLRTS